ncbi:hypothetical protein FB566_2805 [Stackebrandtia endophytica]|uniref:Uncharacterized protein n=1 Tax=Stackebrandtia endophytica TaxID=1496996 RepID=A0A543AXE7_9ACTN|nr:hypothetical protein [Stackebrandtia endophytica]TQL77251.1 hypothetical protein FB566_2805 [Stackebrandtia endophytica]
MSNEIKDGLDAVLPPGRPPVSLDVDSVVSSGRRARRRRRVIGSGAALSVLAAGALTVALVGQGIVAADESGVVALPGQDADDVEVPVLDPDKDYYWSMWGDPHAPDSVGSSPYGQDENETSRALTDRFWSYLMETYPGVTLWENVGYSTDEEPENQGWEEVPGDPAEVGYILQHTNALFEGSDDFDPPAPIEDLVMEQTSYGTYQSSGSASSIGGVDLRFTDRAAGPIADDRVVLDLVGVHAYPAGSHTVRTGDILDLLPDCENHVECETEDLVGPDGQDIRVRTAYGQWSEEGPTDSIISHTVVLYKEDGSAIMLSNTMSLDTAEYEEDPVPPALSVEQLMDFAIAMSTVEIV